MKKALIAINALFFVIICFLACQQKTDQPQDDCTKLHAKSYAGQERKGFLNVRLAKEIADAYDADQEKSYISSGGKMTGMEDAHRVWFSIEDLKQFIWIMEDTLCKQGCNMDSLGLGVHIYLAKYPDSSRIKEFGVDPKYANHQTLFFTATYRGGKGGNIDFDPWHIGTEKCRPTPLSAFIRPVAGKNAADDFDDDAGVLNHGNLAPPPDGTGGFPSNDN